MLNARKSGWSGVNPHAALMGSLLLPKLSRRNAERVFALLRSIRGKRHEPGQLDSDRMQIKPVSLSVAIVSWNAKRTSRSACSRWRNSLRRAHGVRGRRQVVLRRLRRYGEAAVPGGDADRNAAVPGLFQGQNIGIRRCTGDRFARRSDIHVLSVPVESSPSPRRTSARSARRSSVATENGRCPRKGFPRLWNRSRLALTLYVVDGAVQPRAAMARGAGRRDPGGHPERMLPRREASRNRPGRPADERFFIYGEDMDWCKRFWQGRRRPIVRA